MIITTAPIFIKKIKDFGNAFGQPYRARKKILDLQYTKIKDIYSKK